LRNSAVALYHFSVKVLSRSSRNTVSSIAYRAGCELYDKQTGQTFSYEDKAVQHVELLLPKDAPLWAKEVQELMSQDRQKGVQALVDVAEAVEKRKDARVWREFEFALHRELTEEQNMALAREFVEDQICGHGMMAKLNFHFDVDEETGEEKPHCHVVVTTRRLEESGLSAKKEREWNKKTYLLELREQWANYSNFHLKLHGHDIQIDHRSHMERGIEMEPQPKRGRGVSEQEKRTKRSTDSDKTIPVTDKTKEFHDVQLRNLYRIIRKPEIIYDIVTKHHATFMWADIQKKLHQYVDDAHLFQRLDAKLKNSKELILLRLEGIRDPSGNIQDQTIYTTRTMLKAERSLIETAEELGKSPTHGVNRESTDKAITKANEDLKVHGGLSQDQIKAIHHLVDEGQLKCVVGIAGAGKTTALGVCQNIWKARGYSVYGLAPTGKAAQNLEASPLEANGIPSTTLHKFLKAFEEGRSRYNPKSVLILDEAGMVDVERFEKLLSVVKQLGVKLIMVGDGAQLQPVEAGPAFRLVTERLGKSELNTVVRQKEDWQKEATVLFGKQKTEEAIKKYAEKGYVHIVQEKLPSIEEVLAKGDYEKLVKLYEISHRVSSLIYREMAKDIKKNHPELFHIYPLIKEHQDFGRYLEWKEKEKNAAEHILQNSEGCYPILEARSLDPLKMAMLFVDRKQEKNIQQEEAKNILKNCKLDHLIGVEKPRNLKSNLKLREQSIDVRKTAKEELLQSWHSAFKACPSTFAGGDSRAQDPGKAPEKIPLSKESVMLAYSNKDVNDLNRLARLMLKESGHLPRQEFIYKTKKQVEDDFGRRATLKEEKSFSKGDRIVFTRNTYGLGVKNGTTGTIISLNDQKVHVRLDEGKEISFAPNLNPYFDHGWAMTIHKSQGTTFDKVYVLASFEMTQNLAYVAMTRHREWVKVFGSSLDFWREEKLPQVLSKSGEKLSAADYLDGESLTKLMQRDDHLITKIFERIAGELDAMGTVSKKAFWQVADHFLGITREKEIRVIPEGIREEVRAEELLRQESNYNHNLKAQKLPISQNSLTFKNSYSKEKLNQKGIDEGLNAKAFLQQKNKFSHSQDASGSSQKISKLQKQPHFFDAKAVEEILKQNMSAFADDIFSSIGAPYNHSVSSSTERRYGKKGHIAVNLKTGAWIDHKNSEMSGGPLHMLTKLKGLSFKEAIDYGASWAGLSQAGIPQARIPMPMVPQEAEKETLERNDQKRIEKAQALWKRGKSINGTLAERYLRDHRKIEGDISHDLKYLPQFRDSHSGNNYPCLMAAARSTEGNITAVQLTFLDPQTASKANIETPKKSYGLLKGSFVTLQEARSLEGGKPAETSNLLFIAEGVETALSLKSAGLKGTIKASLGLSNMKRLVPENHHMRIIICADHDAFDSPATQSLEKSIIALKEKRFSVTVVKSDKLHEDFNDVLKREGPQKVKEIIEKRIFPQTQKQVLGDNLTLLERSNESTRKKTFWQKLKASFKESTVKENAHHDERSSVVFREKKESSLLHPSPGSGKNLSLQRKIARPQPISEELKRKILGDDFYQRVNTKKINPTASQTISEELKREMLGDEFYNKIYGKAPSSKHLETEKLSRTSIISDIQEDHTHCDQDISISQRPTSRGRKK
jgi:Ti-type conjugative transfer relaxase TraA